jgi:hypothetical protein
MTLIIIIIIIIQEFRYRDKTNVEPEMYDYTSNNWNHWNSNEKLKEKFGSCTRNILDYYYYYYAFMCELLVAGFWSRRPDFDPCPFCVRFVICGRQIDTGRVFYSE